MALLRNLWFGVLALAAAVLVAWLLAGRISDPLRRLAADAAIASIVQGFKSFCTNGEISLPSTAPLRFMSAAHMIWGLTICPKSA